MRQLLIPPLQLDSDRVPLLLVSVLDHRLHDTARIVLEHDLLVLAFDDSLEGCDVLLALALGNILLPRERPGALRLGEEVRVRFRSAALCLEGLLDFVGLTRS